MDEQTRPLQDLQHIKQMMERSSRFTALSSLSGISAGVCGLAGAWIASQKIDCWQRGDCNFGRPSAESLNGLLNYLLVVALLTFVTAFLTAFVFTLWRSKKTGLSLRRTISLRLIWNIAVPLLAGGLLLIRLIQLGQYGLAAPCCLIFYGLGLVNAGKYTLSEVSYLGYAQLLLGIGSLWAPAYGLYFWAAGFGIFHIVYGLVMWARYERNLSHPISTTVKA
jgi:hypothetical protein